AGAIAMMTPSMTGSAGTTGTTTPPVASDCAVLRLESHAGLQLLVDESVSMLIPADMWSPLGNALDAMIPAQPLAPLDAGVEFFQGTCDPGAYERATIPLQPAGQQAQIANTMGTRSHGLGAATAPALAGAIAQARAWSLQQHTSTSVLLITASEPTTCPGDGAT